MSRVVDILERGGVLLPFDPSGFDDVLGDLLDKLIANGCLDQNLRDEALEAVLEREALSSTVMVDIGVSIPHARVDGVAGVVGAIAVSPDALYQAMEGVPIRIMVLVLSAPDLAGEHLNVLAGLSMMLQSQSVREGLVKADGAASILARLREQSARRGN